MEFDMNHKWKRILHYISVCGMFMIIFGALSLLQMYTVGIIFNLNAIFYNGIPIMIIVYSVISILIIIKFFDISSPYK